MAIKRGVLLLLLVVIFVLFNVGVIYSVFIGTDGSSWLLIGPGNNSLLTLGGRTPPLSSVDVNVTISAIRLPTVTNGVGATSVEDTAARLNGEVTDTGNENPSVTVFYGQSDGGTTPASWSDNVSLGAKALGTFYYDASGLTPNQLYYYRMYATNAAGSDWADSSANFTTTYQCDVPEGFTLTDLGAITVTANWTTGTGATYTMVRASRTDYPATPDDGEFIYYGSGTSVNSTGYDLDVIGYYFSAFAYLADNVTYGSEYATASIGGEGMTELAESVDGLTTVFGGMATTAEMLFGLFLAVGLFTLTLVIKDWETKLVLLVISGLAAVYVGLEWLASSPILCIVITGLGTFQLIQAVVLALSTGGQSKGFSQFKGIVSNIKGWF